MNAVATGTEKTEIVADDPRQPVHIPDHTLLRVIGRGSYGEVWEARNVMGTPRAVKVVRRQDFDYARPFDREFEGIQRYEPVSRSHAGLVHVLHVGKGPEGDYFYYVMELADPAEPEKEDEAGGETERVYAPKTLRGELHRCGVLTVEECIGIGMNLASALGHLHRLGLVHRDVKPSNIIFAAGAPKLADVGLVARLSDSRSIVGTEGYFAPEGTGQPGSDVFSLGKVLYECVTGLDRMRFPDVPDSWGSGPETRASFEFMEIVLRASESNPDRRYKDTDEMLADLALLQAGKSLRYLRRVETRLRRMLQVTVFSSLIIATAGGAWFYERYRRGQVESAQQAAYTAQRETQRLLGESLVAEARAVRQSGQAGAREKALESVKRGKEAGASITDLRTQAASALALTDVGTFTPWEASGLGSGRPMVWSPDGGFQASNPDGKGGVSITRRDDGVEIASFAVPGYVADMALSPGAKWLAVLHHGGKITLWNVRERHSVWEHAASGAPHVPSFSGDGEWVVFGSPEGIIARACAGGAPVALSRGGPVYRGVLLAPNGKWLAATMNPSKGPDGKEVDLGFRIFTGLPGGVPAEKDAAGLKVYEIISDIRLEGPSISADSRYVAAAVAEDRLRVWEVPSLAQVAWLRGHQRSVRGTAFHPHNSSMIASTSWDGTTRLWDIPTRREVLVVPVGGDGVLFAPDRGEMLLRTWGGDMVRSASLSRDSALRVLMLPPNIRFGLFSGIGFSPDGQLLSVAGDAGVFVWDLQDGQALTVRMSTGQNQWRDAVFSSPDGVLWYSGVSGVYRQHIVREAAGGLKATKPEQILSGSSGDLEWVGGLLGVSARETIERQPCVTLLKDAQTVREVLSPVHAADNISASADGRWMAASGYPYDGGTLWDLKGTEPVITGIKAAGRSVFGFSKLQPVLMVGTDREVRFDALPGQVPPGLRPLGRKNSEVVPGRSVASPDGSLVAISTGPTEVTLCDGRSLKPLLTLDSSLTPFDCVMTFSPDGRKLALAGGVSRVVIWDIGWLKEELERRSLGW